MLVTSVMHLLTISRLEKNDHVQSTEECDAINKKDLQQTRISTNDSCTETRIASKCGPMHSRGCEINQNQGQSETK